MSKGKRATAGRGCASKSVRKNFTDSAPAWYRDEMSLGFTSMVIFGVIVRHRFFAGHDLSCRGHKDWAAVLSPSSARAGFVPTALPPALLAAVQSAAPQARDAGD